MTMDRVDFVIPHMGRPEMLRETVDSILGQTVPERIASITVVTRNTGDLTLPADPLLRVIHAPGASSISEQRNLGTAAGSAALIAYLDADIELDPDWLETCVPLLSLNPDRVLVSAMQKPSGHAGRVEQLRTVLSNLALDQSVQFLPGRNLLVYRWANERVGGFPEHLQTCEDYYYTDQLSGVGELFYTSACGYVHLGEDRSLAQTFHKEIWRSESNLMSMAGRPIPLREWPSILLPFWMLCAYLFLVLGLLAPVWLMTGAIMLVMPPVLYALRLYRHPRNQQPLYFLLLFYLVYFTARSIGTLKGARHLFRRKLTE